MAEKKKTIQAKKPAVKKPTMQDRMKTFDGDILRGEYDEAFLAHTGLLGRTKKRKVRYWCFKMRHHVVDGKTKPNAPEGLLEFIEGLPGFAGWKYFAQTWDITGENPFMVVLRLQSVWEEWDQVMNRVAIPIDAPPEQISARIEALTEEYARKEAKKK
jgi:hypothetical protein